VKTGVEMAAAKFDATWASVIRPPLVLAKPMVAVAGEV